MSKAPLNTLSGLRTRVIPKTFDFGGLTLSVERAAAKGKTNPDAHVKKQSASSARASFLDRRAARTQTTPSNPRQDKGGDVTPLRDVQAPPQERQPRDFQNARSSQSGQQRATSDSSPRLNDIARRKINLPDIASRTNTRAGSEYIRDVAAVDRLAAESSIGSRSSAQQQQVSRGYRDRLNQRSANPSPSRFMGRAPGGGSGGFARVAGGAGRIGGAAGRQQKPKAGARPARPKTRAQDLEAARQEAILARRNRARPEPVPYSFDGIDESALSPVLERLKRNGTGGAFTNYERLAQDSRDATRIVVKNRSIVQKAAVMKKIGIWIPPNQPNAQSIDHAEA